MGRTGNGDGSAVKVTMRVLVLGTVGVDVGGEPAQLGARLGRLLAALASRHGDVVSVDRLIDAVWGGSPPAGADKTLKTYVTRLRGQLGDAGDRLIFRHPGYALRLEREELDTNCFEDELDEAKLQLRLGELSRADDLVTSALSRWHGAAYAGFEEEEWARPEHVRLEERLLEARCVEVEIALASGGFEQAAALSKSLTAAHSYSERPCELLMRSLHAAGRQADALREYRDFTRRLADDTGLEPSAELVAVESDVLRTDRAAAVPVVKLRGYELGARIGEGAYSVVHRAVQTAVGREVAIKVIRRELANDPDFVRRFELEAHTVARVEHPNVVPLYDFWREPGAAYLVMRLLEGGSVAEAIRSNGPMSKQQVARLLIDIGAAIEEAHRVGVVHRDIRPGNLLLDANGRMYLSDFGIALPPDHNSGWSSGLNPRWPAIGGAGPLDIAADICGFGLTIHSVLTGWSAPPTDPKAPVAVPSVNGSRSDLGAAVDDVLRRATAASPTERYGTVAEFVSDMVVALEAGPRSIVPLSPAEARNPYVGLHAFDEADAAFYFGRDALIEELLDVVERRPFVAVVGASGIGKSSVVRAGLIPALRHGRVPGSSDWFVATMLPGRAPVDSLETALLRIAVNPPPSLRTQLNEDGGLLRAVRRVLPSDADRVLLVIDQFEEIFAQTDDGSRSRFLDELVAAIVADDSPLRVVVSLRADHYDAPLQHAGLAELVGAGTVVVPPMSPSELEAVIVSPARRVGADVELPLVAELVAAVTEHPAALPLLQFTLTEMYERRTSDLMLLSTHHEIGGLTGALAARADRLVASAGSDGDAVARRVFARLVTVGDNAEDTRRRARRSEFGEDPISAHLIDEFVDARLLTTDRDPSTGEPTVEVAHEALLREWPQLRGWLFDDRADLRTLQSINAAADRWESSGRDSGELARGIRLEAASEFASTRTTRLTELETAWVDASAEAAQRVERERATAAERDRRQNRKLRMLLGGAAVLLLVTVVSAVVALVLRSRSLDSEASAIEARSAAESNAAAASDAEQAALASEHAAEDARLVAEAAEADAERNATKAQAAADAATAAEADAQLERLIAVSAAEAVDEPDRGILLALEAYRQRPDPSTATAVHRALTIDPRLTRIRTSGTEGLLSASLDGDGDVALTELQTEEGSTVQFIDPISGEALGGLIALEGGVFRSVLSPDGSRAAVLDGSTTTTLLSVEHDVVVATVETGRGFRVEFDRSASVAVVHNDDAAIVLDAATGAVISSYPVPEQLETGGIAMSPDGTVFAAAAMSEFADTPETVLIDIVDTQSGSLIRRFDQLPSFPWDLEITSDGRLAVAFADGAVRIYDIGSDGDSDRDVAVWQAFDADVIELASNEGGDLVAASESGAVQLWDVDGTPLGRPFEWSGLISDMALSDDRFVTISTDDRPMVTFGLGAAAVTLDVIEADGNVTVDHHRTHFDEILPGRAGYRVRQLETGDELAEFLAPDAWESGVWDRSFYSPNGEWAYSVGANFEHVAVWSAIGGEQHSYTLDELHRASGIPESIDTVVGRPSNDGTRLFYGAVTDDDGSGAAAWLSIPELELLSGPVELPAIGAALELDDGRMMMAGFFGQILMLSGDLDADFEVIDGSETFRPFDRDAASGLIAMGGAEGDIALFDPQTNVIRPIGDVTGFVVDVAFSPDGARLAVATIEGQLQIIDVDSGSNLGELVTVQPLGERAWPGARWSDDGRAVWFSAGGPPTLVAADPSSWVELACRLVDRELTLDEWRAFVSPTTEPVAACPTR